LLSKGAVAVQKFTAPPRNIIVNVERYGVATYNQNLLSLAARYAVDVKNVFYVFYFGHIFTIFNVFLFSKRFLFLKNVGKGQSGKQINKKHFQNNSNEIDL